MAIVKMNKFSLLAFEEKRSLLLDILQNFNYVHFNDLKVKEDETYLKELTNSTKIQALDEKLDKLAFAIETSLKYSSKEEDKDFKRLDIDEVYKDSKNFDFNLIYDKLIKLVKEREGLVDKNQAIEQKIGDLNPWKDIDVDIRSLYDSKRVYVETGTISSQFYDGLKKSLVDKNFNESLIYRYSEVDKTSFIVAIASLDEEERFKELLREYGFSRISIKADASVSQSLSALKKEEANLKTEIKKIEAEIGDFDKYLEDFYLYQSYLVNEKSKEEATENFLKTSQMDVIEGYIPESMTDRFKADIEKSLDKEYILDIKDADKDDPDVPIILENNAIVEPYESVVETYALPKYNEFDPSLLVAIFYTIFTGFMIGDLGYGVLGVIATLVILKTKDLPKSTEKMIKLFLGISLSACCFGILFGSVFGGIIDVPFGWIDTQTDINTLIVMSLVIGGIALFTALGMKAYMYIRDGKVLDAIYDVVFWYMALAGPIAYALTKNKIGLYVMGVGMIGIVLFAGRDAKSIGGRIGSGVYELYGISSWVGDIVSFLRLMALVLSGGFVAYAVNVIVKMLFGAGIGGIIGGILVFVLFQLFNMFLSYLSAYVHSLRLIYVEMFGKFYEGGGVKFKEMLEDTKKILINRGERK
ncbi:V-type ATP synthase subunit I [uncultured Anaerococcus sp.]|uniref:V-type ATP synthase subunit I n=1 Tax=uncultured Anaerococcus sp. TaxID=293428 RepID=UPI0026255726|nr:V-type ATP synthase subunit I [uncultured Anaerococcus sp.]